MPRKLIFIGAALALACFLVEAFSFVAYRAVEGRFLSFAESQRERDEIIAAGRAIPGEGSDAAEEAASGDPAEHPEQRRGDSKKQAWGSKTGQTQAIGSFSHTLHPYLGHVLLPGSTYGRFDVDINQYGFADGTDPLRGGEDSFVVAITGGSLALQFYIREKEGLAELLAAEPALTTKPIEVISLAVSGYKQPQQLLAVNYFLSLGGQIDLLINIDGFNEVAWPAPRTFAGYPLSWTGLTAGGGDSAEIALIGRIGVLRDVRLQLAHGFSRMRLSATANLAWTLADLQLERAIVTRNQELEAGAEGTEPPYFRTGPKVELDGSVLDLWVAIWRDSSLQLHALEQAGQLRYFHFLQPNQYADGGKVLSARERRTATGNRLFARTVPGAFARLRRAGRELAAAGVHFGDLTPIYDEVDETIYTDTCCHVNQRGNELITEEIVRFIRSSDGDASPD